MAEKRLRISEFNQQIRKIKSSEYDLFAVTLKKSIQQTYPNIIIEHGARAGEIRTFKEYQQQLMKVLPPDMRKKEFLPSYEEFKGDVESLVENVKKRKTLSREIKFQEQFMKKQIKKYLDVDVDKMSFSQLKSVFQKAQEAEYSAGYKGGRESGDRWKEDLERALEEVLNERETQRKNEKT